MAGKVIVIAGKVAVNEPTCIREMPGYEYGYESGLKSGIFNTLNYLTGNGYIKDSDFFSLLELIENENEIKN